MEDPWRSQSTNSPDDLSSYWVTTRRSEVQQWFDPAAAWVQWLWMNLQLDKDTHLKLQHLIRQNVFSLWNSFSAKLTFLCLWPDIMLIFGEKFQILKMDQDFDPVCILAELKSHHATVVAAKPSQSKCQGASVKWCVNVSDSHCWHTVDYHCPSTTMTEFDDSREQHNCFCAIMTCHCKCKNTSSTDRMLYFL